VSKRSAQDDPSLAVLRGAWLSGSASSAVATLPVVRRADATALLIGAAAVLALVAGLVVSR
jgi:hypothetical protein